MYMYFVLIPILLIIFLIILKRMKSNILFIKKKAKLPGYPYIVFYTDERMDKIYNNVIYSKILYSQKYDIRGKPDYIYKHKNKDILLPVELKSGFIGDRLEPKKNDVMQLSMYFLIIEDIYKIKPKKGYLIYRDAMFVIKNNSYLKKETLSILSDMRNMLITGDQQPNASFINCKHCICRGTVCEYCSNK